MRGFWGTCGGLARGLAGDLFFTVSARTFKHNFNWGWGSGGVKSTGVSQSVRETGRDESQNVRSTQKLFQNKRFGAPNFLGISPTLFAALRGIHPYLCTPALDQFKRNFKLFQRGGATQWRGKHTIKPLPQNGFGPPTYDRFPPPPLFTQCHSP